jgi:hypothetical protein
MARQAPAFAGGYPDGAPYEIPPAGAMEYSYRFISAVRTSQAAGHDTGLCSMATINR